MNGTARGRRLGAVVVAGLLVLAVAACGGGSSSSAPSVVSNESTTSTTRATPSTTTSSGGTADLGDALGGVGGTAGTCLELGVAYASISLSLLGGGFGAALGQDPSELAQAQQQLEDIQADVPAELRDDFAELEKGFQAFSSALQGGSGNILDPAYQQQLEEAGKALETPEFTAAQKNIENYLDANCGGG
jgi:hypothetical protein